MKAILRLRRFVTPYWKTSLVALFMLTSIVFMDLAIPRLTQRIIDQGIAQNNQALILQTTLLMLGISLLSTLFAIGNNYLSILVGESVARDIRQAMFLRIQAFSFGDLDRLNTGNLMVRLTSDTSAFQRLVQVSLRIGTRAPLLMLGSLILMFNTDRSLALSLLPLLLLMGGVIAFFVTKMGPLYLAVQQKMDRLNTVLQENIAGVRVVKAFVQSEHENSRFAEANLDYAERSIRVMQFMATMSPLLTAFVNLGIVVAIWAGGLQSIRGDLTLGQIVAFVNYLQTVMGPLTITVMLANVLAAGSASAERVLSVLENTPEVQDAPNARPLITQHPERRPDSSFFDERTSPGRDLLPPDIEGTAPTTGLRVVFENVSFHYNGSSDTRVLDGVSLTAEPGQTVAILGATGSGKSTLVNLIPRFYDVTGGRVLINGQDVRSLTQDSLLAHIAIVPQETVLFSGSVRDNIRYGEPAATQAEVEAAARAAQAHDFILQLPEGYDTHVEARGVNLSGGQKQRIAIARALLARPDILILDDATSSVDVETEGRIQAALETWGASRTTTFVVAGATKQNAPSRPTTFVVAQRISTVLNAGQILVLDDGRVAARGTHRELMRTSPIYQEIYTSQLGAGINGATAGATNGGSHAPGSGAELPSLGGQSS